MGRFDRWKEGSRRSACIQRGNQNCDGLIFLLICDLCVQSFQVAVEDPEEDEELFEAYKSLLAELWSEHPELATITENDDEAKTVMFCIFTCSVE